MMWTEFSKKVVAGAIAPVLVASMAPTMAFAADDASANDGVLVAGAIADTASDDGLSTQAEASTTFTFSDTEITASDDTGGYKISGTDLTINEAGTYLVTGSCADGTIAVKKGVTDVRLILKDLTLAKDGDKAIKFKAGSSGTIEIQGANALSTENDKGVIKANAEADDEDNIVYADDGTTTGGDLVVCGTGTLNLSSSYTAVVDGETEGCDAINCEGDLTVLSGTFNIDVTDDGMHADNTLTIGADGTAGPVINVSGSTEGLEGASVNLLSGTGDIVSADDGINAANADLETYSWPYAINISGGTWVVDAEGDGLDSNGDINVSGGTTTVYGPTSGGEGVFDTADTGGAFTVSGGTLWGLGTADMAVVPTSGSYVAFPNSSGMGSGMGGGMPGGMGGSQMGMPGGMGNTMPGAASSMPGSMGSSFAPQSDDAFGDLQAADLETHASTAPGNMGGNSGVSITAGQTVAIKDSAGNELASTVAKKKATWVLYASNDVQSDETYSLYVNDAQAASGSSSNGTSNGGNAAGQPAQPAQPGTTQPQQGDASGESQVAGNAQQAGTTMYRLYNPHSGEHFYTANADERTTLIEVGWNDEGEAWNAPEKTDTPVFRLYNPYAGDHHYTTDADERDYLTTVGWLDEGIGWYSDESQGQPLYRLYNPNAKTGSHHYTTDIDEARHLIDLGWHDEGIGWYGI